MPDTLCSTDRYFAAENLRLLVSDHNDGIYHEGTPDKDDFREHLELLSEGYLYLCGPPVMTAEIIQILKDLGIDEEKIVHENF